MCQTRLVSGTFRNGADQENLIYVAVWFLTECVEECVTAFRQMPECRPCCVSNAQFSYSCLKSCPLHRESSGGTCGAADDSVRIVGKWKSKELEFQKEYLFVEEIPYAAIELGQADTNSKLCYLLAAASFVETTSDLYTRKLVDYFHGDTDVSGAGGEIPAVRAEVARKLVEDYGITIAEIARQVGVSTSAISKSPARSYSS